MPLEQIVVLFGRQVPLRFEDLVLDALDVSKNFVVDVELRQRATLLARGQEGEHMLLEGIRDIDWCSCSCPCCYCRSRGRQQSAHENDTDDDGTHLVWERSDIRKRDVACSEDDRL